MKNNYQLIVKRLFTGVRMFTLAFLLIAACSLQSSASCTAPSSPAGTPVITCASGANMTITWTAAGNSGNCNGYVVIRYTGFPANNAFSLPAGTALPTQGTTPYPYAGNYYGYIEYVGSGLSVTTTNVASGTQYYWYVIPYNNGISGCSPAPVYNVNSVAMVTNAMNTRPAQVASVTNGTPTAHTIPNISFPAVSGADGYLVCTDPVGGYGPLYSHPTDGTVYNVGDFFDDGSGTPWDQTIQYNGPNTSGITASTNIQPATSYAITVYAYVNNMYPCSGGPLYVSPVSHVTGAATTPFNTGIAESLTNTGSVFVYPNPSSSQIFIHTTSIDLNETVNVVVINLFGETVQTGKLKWSDNNIVDIKTLAAGIYFLKINTSNSSIATKFIKQ